MLGFSLSLDMQAGTATTNVAARLQQIVQAPPRTHEIMRLLHEGQLEALLTSEEPGDPPDEPPFAEGRSGAEGNESASFPEDPDAAAATEASLTNIPDVSSEQGIAAILAASGPPETPEAGGSSSAASGPLNRPEPAPAGVHDPLAKGELRFVPRRNQGAPSGARVVDLPAESLIPADQGPETVSVTPAASFLPREGEGLEKAAESAPVFSGTASGARQAAVSLTAASQAPSVIVPAAPGQDRGIVGLAPGSEPSGQGGEAAPAALSGLSGGPELDGANPARSPENAPPPGPSPISVRPGHSDQTRPSSDLMPAASENQREAAAVRTSDRPQNESGAQTASPMAPSAASPAEHISSTTGSEWRNVSPEEAEGPRESGAIRSDPLFTAPADTKVRFPAQVPPSVGHSVAHQISVALATMPDQPVEISLSPEELGRVRLTLHAADQGMTVSIQTERPETLDLMRRHIDSLAREMRDLGYETLSFNFGQPNGQERFAQDMTAPESRHQPDDASFEPVTARPALPPQHGAGASGLDLRL
ncbi:flagellar hook-length control protein FliK [Thioclava atlantica]|nr:flagellar hook-length control protein FliK [Thioclava atlantica]